MTKSLIDDAFNWFVLILSMLLGVLLGFPETLTIKIKFVSAFVPPMLILIIIWLWSYLAEKTEYKVILKSSAWFLAFHIFFLDILVFLYIVYPQIAAYITNGQGIIYILAYMFSPFIVYIVAVRPKYRRIFEDSSILRSIPLLGLLYIVEFVGILPFTIIPKDLSMLLFGL